MKTTRKNLILIAAIVVVFGPFSFFLYRRSVQWDLVDQRMDALRARREPLAYQELYTKAQTIPIEENAGPLLQLAVPLVSNSTGSFLPFLSATNLPPAGVPLSAPMRQDISSWVAANTKPLALAIEAARRPHCYLFSTTNKSWTDGSLLPFVQSRQLAQLLAADFVLKVSEGKSEEAFDRIMAGLTLAEAFKKDSVLVTYTIGNAIQGLMGECLKWGFPRIHFNDIQVDQLHRKVKSLNDSGNFRHMLQGERAIGLAVLSYARKGQLHQAIALWPGDSKYQSHLRSRMISLAGQLPRQQLDYMEFMADHIEASKQPLPQWAQESESLHRKWAHLSPPTDEFRYRHWALDLMVPKMQPVLETTYKTETKMELLIMALKLSLHWRKSGVLPQKISDLGPVELKNYEDPWEPGKWIGYRKLDGGFELKTILWGMEFRL